MYSRNNAITASKQLLLSKQPVTQRTLRPYMERNENQAIQRYSILENAMKA